MEYLLLFIFICITIYEYQKKGRWTNALIFTLWPYVGITFLNNTVFCRMGYFKVNNNVMLLLMLSLIPLYFGILSRRCLFTQEHKNSELIKEYSSIDLVEKNIGLIEMWFFICCIIRAGQLFLLYRKYGIVTISQSDFSEFGLHGIASHLFLTVYPIAAFLFYYAIKKKRSWPMILYIIGMLVAAASFIKYHAIFYALFTFIYCILKDSSLARKLIIMVTACIVALFIGNYIIGFALRNITNYGLNDYFIKLWDYIGGSMINGNVCLEEYKTSNYTVSNILFSSLTPVLNMFATKIVGASLNTTMLTMGFRKISSMGTTSNVMGLLLCNLYTGSIVFYVIYIIIWGFVIEGILLKIDNKANDKNLPFYSMFLTVSLMTFFANYFELSAIWELLFWSYCIPKLFLRKRAIIIKFGSKKLI